MSVEIRLPGYKYVFRYLDWLLRRSKIYYYGADIIISNSFFFWPCKRNILFSLKCVRCVPRNVNIHYDSLCTHDLKMACQNLIFLSDLHFSRINYRISQMFINVWALFELVTVVGVSKGSWLQEYKPPESD